MNSNESNHDPERTFTPPARLAERLQRRSNSRRRSSAHSSRRSSISSLHSRTSSLSCHGGPYSTHIAQHLRRASIIENRKARLAERAAHAEQVRLRAAAAKAAPRVSNCEEKALAAQVARDKHLAEIAARCEEEVKRAKRIATETKEKKAAEHARLEAQIAEKSADAARRRSHYQTNFRRPRTTSLAAVEEKKIDRAQLKTLSTTAAVKVIQRTWKSSYARRTTNAFLKLGISVENFKTMDFEEVTQLISSEDAIATTMRLAKHLGLLDGETDENAKRGAIRVFMSAFMIVAHPEQTFSNAGQSLQEKDLFAKASTLTNAIEATLQASATQQTSSLSRDQLQFIFQDFTSGFHTWKGQDLGVLVDMLIRSFVNLDLIVQSTKDDRDGHVAEEYQQAVKNEQAKIIVRLKRLLGNEKALDRIRKAVRKARRELAAQQTPETTRHVPRASTPTEMDIDLSQNAILTPPATPVREPSSEEQVAALYKKLGLVMTVLPSNREITHEILINGTYAVKQKPWTESKKRMLDAFRLSMHEALNDGRVDVQADWVRYMVRFIRSKLDRLYGEQHPLASTIHQFLDADFIAQQVIRGVFVYDKFFEAIAGIIKKLCSPGRDELVQQFVSNVNGDAIDRLFDLINILDLMILDHVNYQFAVASKHVRENGFAYETQAFEKWVEEAGSELPSTKTWWRAARSTVSASLAPNTTAFATAVYARGLCDLVFQNAPLKYERIPETLGQDFIRLLNLRASTFQMVAVASVLLTSKIRLRRNREALWNREADQLMRLKVQSTDAAAIVSQIESGHMMPDSTKSGLLDFVSRVLPTVVAAARQLEAAEEEREKSMREERAFDPSLCHTSDVDGAVFREQVATFMLKSVREHIYARLAASTAAEKARVASSASETLARIGMPEFVNSVGDIVGVLERIRFVDTKTHSPWYERIAESSANDL